MVGLVDRPCVGLRWETRLCWSRVCAGDDGEGRVDTGAT